MPCWPWLRTACDSCSSCSAPRWLTEREVTRNDRSGSRAAAQPRSTSVGDVLPLLVVFLVSGADDRQRDWSADGLAAEEGHGSLRRSAGQGSAEFQAYLKHRDDDLRLAGMDLT